MLLEKSFLKFSWGIGLLEAKFADYWRTGELGVAEEALAVETTLAEQTRSMVSNSQERAWRSIKRLRFSRMVSTVRTSASWCVTQH